MRLQSLLRASGRTPLFHHPTPRAPFSRTLAPTPHFDPNSHRIPLPAAPRPPEYLLPSFWERPFHATSLARAGSAATSPSPMGASAAPEPEVIGLRKGNAALAVLNRPKALNSLNDNMVTLLHRHLQEWEGDSRVNLVIVKSDGRAFCAGGDVRRCHDLANQGKGQEGAEFFRKEYDLNHLVATYKKPYVAIINGVCMGGGNGISMHAPFRVVTEKVLFAMPETLIGLHPDVGASYFLPRLPGHLGEFLALTGARLKASDMLACGLATHIVSSERVKDLEERLQALRIPDRESIDLAIREYADAAHPLELSVMPRMAAIDSCFQYETVEEIMAALMEGATAEFPEAEETPEDADSADAEHAEMEAQLVEEQAYLDAQWCTEALAAMQRVSPTSLKVSLRSIREGRYQTLEECLVKETRLSFRCMEPPTSHDFVEGVRALLVDKDNSPKFMPPTVEEVTEELVQAYFQPFADKSMEWAPRRNQQKAWSRL